MQQSKNVCFTLNNYTEEDKNLLKQVKCKYICIRYEKGEEGTPHIQGFIQFENKIRLTGLKKIHKKAHWEFMRGTTDQAINYCKKDGIFEEKGEVTKMGQRNDIIEAKKKVCQGGLRAILHNEAEYNLQTIRICEKMLTYHEEKRNWKPHVTWIWGKTGSGKSKMAFEKVCQGDDCYEKDQTKWWDGYDKHKTVIMDDFRSSNMKLNELLKILDRYPHRIECKGGYRQLLAKNIIITCILHPKDAYNVPEEPIEQLLRRIDEIIHCN